MQRLKKAYGYEDDVMPLGGGRLQDKWCRAPT